jgi:hypothetical protein
LVDTYGLIVVHVFVGVSLERERERERENDEARTGKVLSNSS